MDYTSADVHVCDVLLSDILAGFAAIPTAAFGATGKLRLSTDTNFTASDTVLPAELADFEADYTGYTAGGVSVVWTSIVNPATSGKAIRFDHLFTATEPVAPAVFVPNTVFGWWIDDGSVVLAMERLSLPAGAGLGVPGDYLALGVLLGFTNTQRLS